MGWSIVVPEDTTNQITNPSFEYATTGWTAYNSSLAVDDTYQAYGSRSLKITAAGGAAAGAYYRTPTLTGAASYTFSTWVYVPTNWDGGNVTLLVSNTGYTEVTAAVPVTTRDKWVRIFVQITAGANIADLYVYSTSTPTAGRIFYVDGAQFEQKAYMTDYCDGSQDGCRWTGAYGQSISDRDSRLYPAGREYDLADDLDFLIAVSTGTGVLPVQNHSVELALQPGGLFTGQKLKSRSFSLKGTITGSTPADFHTKKSKLVRALLSKNELERGSPGQRILRYKDFASEDKEILAVYDGGLESGLPLGWTEADIEVRFIADNPMFTSVLESGAELDCVESPTIYGAIAKRAGAWDTSIIPAAGGSYDWVHQIKYYNGEVYVVGRFTNWDNQANLDYAAKWTGSAWTYIGDGTVINGEVRAIDFDSEGQIYIGGYFVNLGPSNADYLAVYTGSAWDNVGLGGGDNPNADVYALRVMQDNSVVIGGDFTNVAAIANTNHIAKFIPGSGWVALGTGVNLDVYHLERDSLGNIYAGGTFTLAGGVTGTSNIAKWNGSAWEAMDAGVSGASGSVDGVYVASDNSVYISGAFTIDGHSNALLRLARWTGSVWREVGGGINGTAHGIKELEDGTLAIAGSFSQVGVNLDNPLSVVDLAFWDGYRWYEMDIQLPSAVEMRAPPLTFRDELWLAGKMSAAANTSGSTTLTYHGTAPTYPIFTFKKDSGIGQEIRWIENTVTGARLIFDKMPIQTDEIITIDTRPGYQKIWSSVNGDYWNYLSPGSDLSEMFLVPGDDPTTGYENPYLVYVLNGLAATNLVRFKPAYYSED